MLLTFLVAALKKQKETGIQYIQNILLISNYNQSILELFKIKSLKLGLCFIVLEHLSLG